MIGMSIAFIMVLVIWSPENLLRIELIPAFQETLGATAALMSAEDYFQGGKTEFNNEFQRQMESGIYIVGMCP